MKKMFVFLNTRDIESVVTNIRKVGEINMVDPGTDWDQMTKDLPNGSQLALVAIVGESTFFFTHPPKDFILSMARDWRQEIEFEGMYGYEVVPVEEPLL